MDGGTGDATDRPAGADERGTAGVPWLLAAVLYKKVLLLLRYPVNTAARMLTVYVFFALMFFGGRAVAGRMGAAGAITSTLEGLIVGWFLWTMSITAYFGLSTAVTTEAQWGTLEQLYMSPYGFGTVMTTTIVASLMESFVWGGVMLALMLLTTSQEIAVNLLTVGPVTVLALMTAVGLGFGFAGLALVYKRIENVSQMMQFVLIGLIAAPVANVPWLRFLPLVQGSAMLQEAMREGTRLWEFPAADLAVLAGAAVAYWLAGYAVFLVLTRRARRLGVMGHY